MAGFTNRGKMLLLKWGIQQVDPPTNLYVALVTSAVAPDEDTNTLSQLTEIEPGNGYVAGGFELTPNGIDFDVITEDDATDRAFVQIKDVVWTADTGPIPASGNGARYAILTDDAGTPNALAYWDLVTPRQVSDTQTLTLEDCELRINES